MSAQSDWVDPNPAVKVAELTYFFRHPYLDRGKPSIHPSIVHYQVVGTPSRFFLSKYSVTTTLLQLAKRIRDRSPSLRSICEGRSLPHSCLDLNHMVVSPPSISSWLLLFNQRSIAKKANPLCTMKANLALTLVSIGLRCYLKAVISPPTEEKDWIASV